MTALVAALCAAAVLGLLLLGLRLRLRAVYDREGFSLTFGYGHIRLLTWPERKRPGREAKGSSGAEKLMQRLHGKASELVKGILADKHKKKTEEEAEAGGETENYFELLPIITDALGKLRRRLVVDELTLWYQAACADPADAALAFGGVSAAVPLLLSPLERLFHIRRRDIRTAVSFTEKKPTVYLRLRLSLSPFQALRIALHTAIRLKKSKRSGKPEPDTEEA